MNRRSDRTEHSYRSLCTKFSITIQTLDDNIQEVQYYILMVNRFPTRTEALSFVKKMIKKYTNKVEISDLIKKVSILLYP